jgi:hypothetical protein
MDSKMGMNAAARALQAARDSAANASPIPCASELVLIHSRLCALSDDVARLNARLSAMADRAFGEAPQRVGDESQGHIAGGVVGMFHAVGDVLARRVEIAEAHVSRLEGLL